MTTFLKSQKIMKPIDKMCLFKIFIIEFSHNLVSMLALSWPVSFSCSNSKRGTGNFCAVQKFYTVFLFCFFLNAGDVLVLQQNISAFVFSSSSRAKFYGIFFFFFLNISFKLGIVQYFAVVQENIS